MSDSKRKSPSGLDSTFSDDIETICAQIGFDPKLYIEFPRKRNRLSPIPEAELNAGPAPATFQAGTAKTPGPVATPPVSQPASAADPNLAARPEVNSLGQPPASEFVQQVQLQPAVHSSWPGLSAAVSSQPNRSAADSPQPARTPQSLSPARALRPAQSIVSTRSYERPSAASPAPGPEAVPPGQKPQEVQGSRAGLRALFDEMGGDDRPLEQRPQRRARALVVTTAVSGMGCTTLTATLARYYQSRGEGVLIFDDREDGLLKLHFEAENSAAIPILNRKISPTLSSTWFQEPMTVHQLDYRWFLMDTKAVTPALVNTRLVPGSCYLVPVLADMRGIKAALALSEQLDSYENEQGRRLPFYFVLNQFDSASRLQEEIRQHLMRRLGSRLAPVTIRWSEEIGAALAEGTTVLDYAPESPASRDFENLGDWLADLA